MNDNLFGFSSKSFEQFIQALAMKIIGPGITVFGSGPDGGREATFEGTLGFPFEGKSWSGYGVIQAKCKEKTEGTQLDQQWALDQLGIELDRFTTKNTKRRKPDFYVFVTNVVLTPAPNGGGKDKAAKLISDFHKKLPLKDYRLWDADQINIYLHSQKEIRERFSVQLTPGDILAKLSASLEQNHPNFTTIVTSYLSRQLIDDEDARLDQAGHRVDQRTSLARVFVDLPVELEPTEDPPDEDEPDGLRKGFLHELMQFGAQKLDAKSLEETKRETEPENLPLWTETNRWVLIGGPGSGKSTISQFIAQVHRAGILDRREPHTIAPELKTIISQIKHLCKNDGISWPATPRFPFRVELSAFARSLAGEVKDHKSNSLLSYLAQKVRGNFDLNASSLLNWLSQYPSLLILDGLDEVPSSSNRTEVCRAIQDFLTEAALVNADLLTLATTRPSGYNEEFGKEHFEYRYLPPLSINRSILYARRFAETRFGPKSSRVEEMATKLLEASRDTLTARLMRTPLQVTFMATLVAAGGRPPQDRWKLFRDYYDTIYKREQQKASGELRAVLDKQDTLIHRAHHDIGLLLQAHGENEGATDSMMSLRTFSNLVDDYLKHDGWEDPSLSNLSKTITEEARTRLVFLSSRIADKISFDVRSLQEYMAAERLMTGSHSKLQDRLRAIAALAYWRNTFLFVAGQCFASPQLQHLRSLIHQTCQDINDLEFDRVLGLAQSGSRLSLDILEDGTVSNSPNFARCFSKLALQLVDNFATDPPYRGHPQVFAQLARIYNPHLDNVFRDHLCKLFQTKASPAAWALLCCLIEKNIAWAKQLAEKHWPNSLKDQIPILATATSGEHIGRWLLFKLEEVIPSIGPPPFFVGETSNFRHSPRWLAAAFEVRYAHASPKRARLKIPSIGNSAFSLIFEPIFIEQEEHILKTLISIRDIPNPSKGWLPLISAANFALSPSKDTLAVALETLAEAASDVISKIPHLPWPIKVCLSTSKNSEDLRLFAKNARLGNMGDAEDWQTAERRWIDDGIDLHEIKTRYAENLPFDKEISIRGYPINTLIRASESITFDSNITSYLCDILSATKEEWDRNFISRLIASSILSQASNDDTLHPKIPIDRLKLFFSCASSKRLALMAAGFLEWPEELTPDMLEVFNSLGNQIKLWTNIQVGAGHSLLPEKLAFGYALNPTFSGLLNILACFCLNGRHIPLSECLLTKNLPKDPQSRLASIVLLLINSQAINPQETIDLIIDLHRTAPSLHPINLVFKALKLSKSSLHSIEEYVLLLRSQFFESDQEVATQCNSMCSWLISRRSSGLKNQLTAKELDLPWLQSL
jgi:hypothetical protein